MKKCLVQTIFSSPLAPLKLLARTLISGAVVCSLDIGHASKCCPAKRQDAQPELSRIFHAACAHTHTEDLVHPTTGLSSADPSAYAWPSQSE